MEAWASHEARGMHPLCHTPGTAHATSSLCPPWLIQAHRAGEDVLIGKVSPLPEEAPGMVQRFTTKDASTSLRQSESGVVDQVMLSTNEAGHRFVKSRVRPAAPGRLCAYMAGGLRTWCMPSSPPVWLRRWARGAGALSSCHARAMQAARPP